MNNKIDNISCSSYNDFLKNFETSVQKRRTACPPDLYFFQFMESVINDVEKTRSTRLKECYTTTFNSFKKFRHDTDIAIPDLSNLIIEQYEHYLRERELSLNSISFYMRILRAVYNRAVLRGLTTDRLPFKNVYTSIPRTVKRAMNLYEMKKLARHRFSEKHLEWARDLFMFSFYANGMSFIDMAYLRRSNISNGMLTYRRKKTGQTLEVFWSEPLQKIVEKYAGMTKDYLLPIITTDNPDNRNQFRYRQCVLNNYLKAVAQRIRFRHPLTMYVARHSWASIAHNLNISMDVISRGMGHDSEQTTQIYVKTIDNDAIRRANERIIRLLRY